ncbi:MAG: glycosyltransferase family 1 protein, partial [Solirubrobacteraceae bacterium]
MTRARSIILNALFLDPDVSGGPETYLRGLAPALRAGRPDAELAVVTTRRGGEALAASDWPARGIRIIVLPCDDGQRVRRQIAEQIRLPRLAAGRGADILHSLASVAPIRVPQVAHVITLHDVSFIHHSTFGAVTSWGMRQVIPRAARRADALITATRAARDEICATVGLSPEAFTIVPHGVASPAPGADATATSELRSRYGLDGARVVLCVGAKRPHKNQAVLIRALPRLPADIRLVLAGHPEPYEATLRVLTAELGLGERVIFADWVSEADLEGLWSLADVAAFPTLAEGFGLPVVEAMAR